MESKVRTQLIKGYILCGRSLNWERSYFEVNMKNYNLKKIILIAIAAIIFLILGTLLFNELFFKHEEGLVFITNTGDRYHNINCSYLLSMNPIGIEQAKARGYTACARCGGVATGRIEVNNYWASFAIAVAVLLLLCFIIFIISLGLS